MPTLLTDFHLSSPANFQGAAIVSLRRTTKLVNRLQKRPCAMRGDRLLCRLKCIAAITSRIVLLLVYGRVAVSCLCGIWKLLILCRCGKIRGCRGIRQNTAKWKRCAFRLVRYGFRIRYCTTRKSVTWCYAACRLRATSVAQRSEVEHIESQWDSSHCALFPFIWATSLTGRAVASPVNRLIAG